MRIDITGSGIATGLIVAASYIVMRLWRRRDFDVGTTLTVFLAAFTVPTAGMIIWAALLGRQDQLPNTWRENLAAAGMVSIGLSCHFLVKSLLGAWRRAPETAVDAGEAPASESTKG